MLGSGWVTPTLVAAALIGGAGVVLMLAWLYRERARAAEAALRAVVAEAPDQAPIDACAREPAALGQAWWVGADRADG
jgi:hypothetical protein